MSKEIYKACSTAKEGPDYVYGIEGPGEGLGYHAWYGYPGNTFLTLEHAEQAARLMNLAFEKGEQRRAQQIKSLLGF